MDLPMFEKFGLYFDEEPYLAVSSVQLVDLLTRYCNF